MLKKNAWIAALFAATAMLFMGCPEEGGGGGGGGPQPIIGNPIVDANFLRVTGRQNSWDSIDIRAGKAVGDDTNTFTLDNSFTPNKAHTIKVFGSTDPLQGGITLGNTDSPYTNKSPAVSAATNGAFTIEFLYTWDEISDTSQNIRIQMPTTATSFYVYEIIITDEDGTVSYKLSEDNDIQDLSAGATITDDTGVVCLQKAGGPTITVFEQVGDEPVFQLDTPVIAAPVAGSSTVTWGAVPEGGDYKVVATPTAGGAALTITTELLSLNLKSLAGIVFESEYSVTVTALGIPGITTDSEPSDAVVITVGPMYEAADNALFDAVEGLFETGLFANNWGVGGSIVVDTDATGIITRAPGGSALFSIDLTKLTDLDLDETPIVATDTIKINFAAVVGVGQVKLTAKQSGTPTDLTPATYIDLTPANALGFIQSGAGTPPVSAVSIPAGRYQGGDPKEFVSPTVLYFQDNSGGTAAWKLKIVSIEIVHAE